MVRSRTFINSPSHGGGGGGEDGGGGGVGDIGLQVGRRKRRVPHLSYAVISFAISADRLASSDGGGGRNERKDNIEKKKKFKIKTISQNNFELDDEDEPEERLSSSPLRFPTICVTRRRTRHDTGIVSETKATRDCPPILVWR